MPSFIKRFRRNFPPHFPEWICSLVILATGFLWLLFPASFARDDMAAFIELMSPRMWIMFTILLGMLSIVSLAADGESPRFAGMVRIIAGLGRTAMFGAFLGRSYADSEPGVSYALGVILFSAFVIFEIRNVMRACVSTFNAFRKVSRFVPVIR